MASGSTERQQLQNKQIIAQLAISNPNNWPSEMEIDFGEEEIRQLCRQFRLYFSKVRDAFSDFKDSGGRSIPNNLKPLLNSVDTIPAISTNECERGFSAMNVILSDLYDRHYCCSTCQLSCS